MDLARAELEMARGAMFRHGAELGRRMAIEDVKTKRPLESTRRLLAEFPPSEPNLDMRGLVARLTPAELWEGAKALGSECHGRPTTSVASWCEQPNVDFPARIARKKLNVSGWEGVGVKPLRSLSLGLGHALTAIDASETRANDADLRSLCARLFALRDLRLSGCSRVTNIGIQAVAGCCHATLRRLEMARCERLTADSCGWIAGVLGCGAPPCALLDSLDIGECSRMSDDALRFIAVGCGRLRFLRLAGNAWVSDAGVAAIARGCPRLEVVDVGDCRGVGDKGLRSLAQCTRLRTVLAPRISPTIRDAGVRALSRGCRQLATLDIAGARSVSEGVLGVLATRCQEIRTLNVTGCACVTQRTLEALIDGLGGLVREATSFYGFVPVENAPRVALAKRQRALENRASRLICSLFRLYRWRQIARGSLQFVRTHRASCRIAHAVLRWLRRLERRRESAKATRLLAACLFQRNWRAKRGRRFAQAIATDRALLHSKQKYIVSFQAAFRGYLCRETDAFAVGPAVQWLRATRHKHHRGRAATTIQAAARSCLARKRARAYRQLRRRLHDDRDVAIAAMQRVFRRELAKRDVDRRRRARRRRAELLAWASKVVTNAFRINACRSDAERRRRALARRRRLVDRSVRVCQRLARGFFGRLEARRRRSIARTRRYSATKLQSLFRSSRILGWRHIRLNKIAAAVYDRRAFERRNSAIAAERLYADFVAKLSHDSCSDDDNETGQASSQWIYEGGTSWLNMTTGERVCENPVADPVDLELVGCSVRVYWPQMDAWYEGTLGRFNKRRRRYRVEYYDGDREWLDLDANADRVQLFDGTGQWAMLDRAFRPQLEEQRKQRADLKAREQRSARLREESERWEVLDNDDRSRWFNSLTGQVKVLHDDAHWWIEAADDQGLFCFQHAETGQVTYNDPRFRQVDDDPQARQAVLNDLRLQVYLVGALVDDFDKAPSDKDLARVAKRALTAKPVIRNMSTTVARARHLWGSAFGDDAELAAATDVLHRALDILQYAEAQADSAKQTKLKLIQSAKRRVGPLVCAHCNHEIHDASALFCPQCGTSVTT